jgi:hypothetical protein
MRYPKPVRKVHDTRIELVAVQLEFTKKSLVSWAFTLTVMFTSQSLALVGRVGRATLLFGRLER